MNVPPSFSSAGINRYDQEQLQLSAVDTDAYNQPPSYESFGHPQGNSHNQFQDLNHTDRMLDNTKAPSLTDMGHFQLNSYSQAGNLNPDSSGQQPMSIGAMARVEVSQSLDGVDPFRGEYGPNLSDANRREPSQNEVSSTIVFEGPDVQEFAGMNLFGFDIACKTLDSSTGSNDQSEVETISGGSGDDNGISRNYSCFDDRKNKKRKHSHLAGFQKNFARVQSRTKTRATARERTKEKSRFMKMKSS